VSIVGSVIGRALMTGSVASAISAGVLGALAKAEGKNVIQPINATSHWLHGEKGSQRNRCWAHGNRLCDAPRRKRVLGDLVRLQSSSDEPGLGKVIRNAALVSTVAAAVDYGLMPKNLTPGWEGPLPIRSVAGGFLGMPCGLALGGLVTRRVLTRWLAPGGPPPRSLHSLEGAMSSTGGWRLSPPPAKADRVERDRGDRARLPCRRPACQLHL